VYDGAEINQWWGDAWPTGNDVTNSDHEFSPVLQAPVANLLGEPWYLESGSPGGDYVTWLDLPAHDARLGVSPHWIDDAMRWVIGTDGNQFDQDNELLITATPEQVVARVREFITENGIETPWATQPRQQEDSSSDEKVGGTR